MNYQYEINREEAESLDKAIAKANAKEELEKAVVHVAVGGIDSKPKRLSRPQRWAEAASKAVDGLQELVDLQAGYQDWLDNLPDNLSSNAVADKLQAITDLDLEGALDTAREADGIDLPLGFGRD